MYISKQMFKQKCKGFNFAFKPIIYLIVKINNTYYLKNKEKENKQLLDSINKNKLDKNQRKIVLSEEDSTLVIAGAGSGKSLTILARILYLIKNDTNPKDILVISFTNEACNNLKEKLLKNNISTNVLTFHKLGRNILKNNGYSVNLVKENILEEIVSKVLKKTELTYCAKDKNLIKLLTTFINLFKGNGYAETKFNDFENQNKKEKGYLKDRNKELLFLAKQIFYEYQYYLEKNKNIDFHDMINKSIEIVQSKGIYSYKYIIVDEYQDTSLIKCKLLQTIKQKTKANLLAVGDDFQSIYQFTGSNLNVFIKFEKYFPNCKTFKLTTTYRNSRELLKITNNFILKNPKQIYKILTSSKEMKNPICICYYQKDYTKAVKILKQKIKGNTLILGRNNKDLKNIQGNTMTVHKSKGLEADNVIVVNLKDSVSGFPNKIKNDNFLNYVLNQKDTYPFEEERRLFYVALTRTKNKTYLLTDKNNPSQFVLELINDNPNIEIIYL